MYNYSGIIGILALVLVFAVLPFATDIPKAIDRIFEKRQNHKFISNLLSATGINEYTLNHIEEIDQIITTLPNQIATILETQRYISRVTLYNFSSSKTSGYIVIEYGISKKPRSILITDINGDTLNTYKNDTTPNKSVQENRSR